MDGQPQNRMDAIMAARYAPLVLEQPLNNLLGCDYLKYLPGFYGKGETTIEEHVNS